MRGICRTGLILVLSLVGSLAEDEKRLEPILSLKIAESYDSNVYLQQITDKANQDSFVTTIRPTAGFQWNEDTHQLKLTYSPSIAFYHAEPREDHTWHQANFNAKIFITSEWTADLSDKVIWVQGSGHHPLFPGQGNSPSMNIATRDRHAQFVQIGNYAFTWKRDEWLARFLTQNYLHDFQMEHKDPAQTPGYQNFADRHDVNGGFELGYRAVDELYPLIGFRYGRKQQTRIFTDQRRYNYDYQRLLFGLEGKAGTWLDFKILLGPEWRQFDSVVADSFDRNDMLLHVEASAKIKWNESDSIRLSFRRYSQPGAGGRSVYVQVIADAYYRHDFGEEWNNAFIEAGCLAYGGDWHPDTSERNDWMMRPGIKTGLEIEENIQWQIEYYLEKSLTSTNGMPSREYDRHVLETSMTYTFF